MRRPTQGPIVLALTAAMVIAVGAPAGADWDDPPVGQGAWGVECGFVASLMYDPIVGTTNHLHDFYGSEVVADPGRDPVLATADLENGTTTCVHRADNSAMWAPTLLLDEEPIDPKTMVAYYRNGDLDDELLDDLVLPRRLRMIAGKNTGIFYPSGRSRANDVAGWQCLSEGGESDSTKTTTLAALGTCEDGPGPYNGDLRLQVKFPNCWDGEHVNDSDSDVFDQDHVEYSWETGDDDDCLTGWKPMPMVVLNFEWNSTNIPDDLTTIDPGDSLSHADFWNGWTGQVKPGPTDPCFDHKREIMNHCLLGERNCEHLDGTEYTDYPYEPFDPCVP